MGATQVPPGSPLAVKLTSGAPNRPVGRRRAAGAALGPKRLAYAGGGLVTHSEAYDAHKRGESEPVKSPAAHRLEAADVARRATGNKGSAAVLRRMQAESQDKADRSDDGMDEDLPVDSTFRKSPFLRGT